jgi:hypothetical protein
MKVLQHSAARLIVREQLIGVWLLGYATIGIGIFIFFSFKPPVDWLGAALLSLGSLFILSSPTEVFTFDKKAGCLKISQQRLWRRRVIHRELSEIVQVEVETLNVLGTIFYQVNLRFVSGRCLAVTQTISTDWQQQQQIVRHIRSFLTIASPVKKLEPIPPYFLDYTPTDCSSASEGVL